MMQNNAINSIFGSIKSFVVVIKDVFGIFIKLFGHVGAKNAEKTLELSENYRGKPELDYGKCTGCGLCVEVCPSSGMLKINNEEKKLVSIDVSRCSFCGNCAEICPNEALNMTKQYKLATGDKKVLLLEYPNEKNISNDTQTSAEQDIQPKIETEMQQILQNEE